MNYTLAIDPGTTQSAYVIYDPLKWKIKEKGILDNMDMVHLLRGGFDYTDLAIEQIKSYGNCAGDSLFLTCFWSGRFVEAWGKDYVMIPRKTVVTELCLTPTAGDSAVRRVILDMFNAKYPYGKGREPSVGTSKAPGSLYGVIKDIWSALAVALAYQQVSLREALK